MAGASGSWAPIDEQMAGGYISASDYNAAQDKAAEPSLWDRISGAFSTPTRPQSKGMDGATGGFFASMGAVGNLFNWFGGATTSAGEKAGSALSFIKVFLILALVLVAVAIFGGIAVGLKK